MKTPMQRGKWWEPKETDKRHRGSILTLKNELGHYCLGLSRRFILNLVVVLKNGHFAVDKL